MKAIVLAAGRGSRMKGLTDDRPKGLNLLAGRPLLDWQLDALRQAGCDNITVIRGYKSEMLQGQYSVLDNPEWATTNMVSTLAVADTLLSDGECVVSYSDIAVRPSHIREFILTPWKSDADLALTSDLLWHDLWSLRDENPLDDAETFDSQNGWLTAIGDKPTSLDQVNGQYMGLLKFRPAGWQKLQNIRAQLAPEVCAKLDMTTTLRMMLKAGAKIQVIFLKGGWVEADNQKDLETYTRLAGEVDCDGKPWTHDWRDA